MKFYYFDQNKQKKGPVSAQQIRELKTQGIIEPHSVLETDAGHQRIAGQIPGLFPEMQPLSLQWAKFQIIAGSKKLWQWFRGLQPRTQIIVGTTTAVLMAGMFGLTMSRIGGSSGQSHIASQVEHQNAVEIVGDPHAQAHKRVLAELEQIETRTTEAAKTGGIPGYKRAIQQLFTETSNISLSGCSPEFRRDFIDLINALGQFARAVDDQPDGVIDAILSAFPRGLIAGLSLGLQGEFDGGAARLQNDLANARQSVIAAKAELKKYE